MLSISRQKADLAWCVNSPGLIAQQDSSVIWPDDNWFRSFSIGEQIQNYPHPQHPHHFRLGQHFEELLACWLQQSNDLTLVQANQQVFDHKLTVGEFDFLVNYLGEVEHWEVAIKFYLGLHPLSQERSQLNCWYGPNTADRLDLKYHHLVNHQLSLASNEFGKQTLDRLNLQIGRVRCIIKGRLFYPWEKFTNNTFETPNIINANHEKGWWIDEGEIPDENFERIVYLQKQHWLAPITTNDQLAVMNIGQLYEFLALPRTEQATHVALLDESGNELSRGFVVKPIWRERVIQSQPIAGV